MTEKEFREKERITAQKKNRKRVRRKKRAGAIAFLLVLLSLVLVGALSVFAYTYLKVVNITVEGNDCYTAEEIISKTGISVGDSLLFINEDKLSEKLERELPFISGISLQKQLPDTLLISVSETYEESCFYRDGSFFSADGGGKILNTYSSRPENLPIIIAAEGDTLNLGEAYAAEKTEKKAFEDKILSFAKAEGIKLTVLNAGDIYRTYFIIEDSILVELGSSNYIDRKLEFIPKTVADMKGKERNVIDLSDWSPENNAAVSYEKDINSYFVFN